MAAFVSSPSIAGNACVLSAAALVAVTVLSVPVVFLLADIPCCRSIFSAGSQCLILAVKNCSSIGFGTKSFMPSFKNSSLVPSMALAVRAIIGTSSYSGWKRRIMWVVSTPSSSGIIWSIKMMSYICDEIFSMASFPLRQVSICIPSGFKSPSVTVRLIALSSTIKICASGAVNSKWSASSSSSKCRSSFFKIEIRFKEYSGFFTMCRFFKLQLTEV